MTYYGQHGEDKVIESYFPSGYKGVCVDVGAYNGVEMSNSYYFELRGWQCLCIEPIPVQYEICKGYRKLVDHCAVADKEGTTDFTVYTVCGTNQSAISSIKPDERLVQSHQHLINSVSKITVPVKTLNQLLTEYNFPTDIDFISIDTENTELDVLKGLDLNKYNVKLLIIEDNFNEPYIEEYLKPFGYRKNRRLAVNDFFLKETT